MADDRTNLKVHPDTADLLREHKRDGETWDGVLRRAANALAADTSHGSPSSVCSECGAVLVEWVEGEDGTARCFDCADVDREAIPD